jgi:CarD family transcriptional regulator
MYKIGDLIIYGSEGVCRIEDIGIPEHSETEKDRQYYTIQSLYLNERIFSPVDSVVFMRPIISHNEAENLIRQMPDVEVQVYDNRNLNLLEEHYRHFMQTHKCCDLIYIIKSVYLKQKSAIETKKKLGQIDTRYLKRAEDMLYGEFAIALGIPKESVKDYILTSLGDEEI